MENRNGTRVNGALLPTLATTNGRAKFMQAIAHVFNRMK